MIKYNEKTEVTKEQFITLKRNADGICAFRNEQDKYFVKLMIPKYADFVQKVINSNPSL